MNISSTPISVSEAIESHHFKVGVKSYISGDEPDFDNQGDGVLLYELGRQFSAWCRYAKEKPKMTINGIATEEGKSALRWFYWVNNITA